MESRNARRNLSGYHANFLVSVVVAEGIKLLNRYQEIIPAHVGAGSVILDAVFKKENMQHSQEAIEKTITEITSENILAFFQERVKQNGCPVCLSNSWSFVGGPEHTLALMALTKEGGFALPPPNVPVFAIACNHCAYVRTHALGLIAIWKLDKGTEVP